MKKSLLYLIFFYVSTGAMAQAPKTAKPKPAAKPTTATHKAPEEKKDPQNIEMIMDREAQFTGTDAELIDAFMKGIDFPEETIEANMEGEIMFSFFVGIAGNIENARILKSFGNESVDAQALKILEGLKYTPATMNGIVVRSQKMITIPLRAYRKI
jgi:TonB family protein